MPRVEDDPAIGDDERLWHRIHPSQVERDESGQIVRDENGRARVISGAFRDHAGEGTSVHIASLADLEALRRRFPEYGLMEITAEEARRAGCIVVPAPEPEDRSHALLMRRENPPMRLTKNQARDIRNSARWIPGTDP